MAKKQKIEEKNGSGNFRDKANGGAPMKCHTARISLLCALCICVVKVPIMSTLCPFIRCARVFVLPYDFYYGLRGLGLRNLMCLTLCHRKTFLVPLCERPSILKELIGN